MMACEPLASIAALFGSRSTAWPTETVPCPAALATNDQRKQRPGGRDAARSRRPHQRNLQHAFLRIVPVHQRHRRAVLGERPGVGTFTNASPSGRS